MLKKKKMKWSLIDCINIRYKIQWKNKDMCLVAQENWI